MRRTAVITTSFVLAFAGLAFAASYAPGRYAAGSTRGDGVSLRIKRGMFSVSRISFMETCSSDTDSFSERFAFVEGTEAKLKGKINSKGHFSGRYESDAGTVTVTGTVSGSKATVKGSEHGTFYPSSSGEAYECRGSRTFHAKRAK